MKFAYKVNHVQAVSAESPMLMRDGSVATLKQDKVRVELTAAEHDGSSVILMLPVDDATFSEGATVSLSFEPGA